MNALHIGLYIPGYANGWTSPTQSSDYWFGVAVATLMAANEVLLLDTSSRSTSCIR